MPSSPNWSHASGACLRANDVSIAQVEWRPSRLLAAVLALLGLLAGGAVLASEMPRAAAWCLAAAASLRGAQLAFRECARPPMRLVWNGDAGIVSLDGVAAAAAALHWRGPLAFLCWRDAQGGTHRLAFWPDVLDASQRRALRLAARSGVRTGEAR